MENGNTTEVAETTEAVESTATTEAVKEPTFTELIQKPEYQREFDKLVNKSLETAKGKWEQEYQAKLSEAEKLAKMNAEQKLKYELEKSNKERDEFKAQLEASNLYKTACTIANDKGLPTEYLGLIDFSKEDADSITGKIDKLLEIRTKDLEGYMNNKLKQEAPTEKVNQVNKIDPYIEGFNAEFE